MSRRSKRLQKRNMADDKEEQLNCSASESEDENTIVEQPLVADLKEEIRSLKESLRMLLEKTNSSPTEVVSPQQPAGKLVEHPHSAIVPSATAACKVFLPPNNYTTPVSSQQSQERISINNISIPTSFSPNVSIPYYSNSCMPPHNVQDCVPSQSVQHNNYMPPRNVQACVPSQSVQHNNYMPSHNVQSCVSSPYVHNNFMSPPSVQTYMPLPYIQNYIPSQSTQPSTSTSTRQTSASTSTFINTTAATPFSNAHSYEHRPIRKLHDLPEFHGHPEQWPMFSVSYRENKALKGDAKAKVDAYLIHPENVNQVMTTLEFHFGRPQILIRSQISKVRAFPAIPGNRMYEIVNFSSMVSNLTVFLENAGATPHLCNPTLLDELIKKLPLIKREEWVRYSLNNLGQYPSVRDFSMWLHEVATYVSLATETDTSGHEAANNKREKIKSFLAITTEQSRQPNCLNCKQNHPEPVHSV